MACQIAFTIIITGLTIAIVVFVSLTLTSINNNEDYF